MSQVPRNRNTHKDSLATLATSSAQNLPRLILVEDLCNPTEVKGNSIHVHQIRWVQAGWTLLYCSLRKMFCLRISPRLTKCKRKLLGFGYLRTRNCISDPSLAHTCCANTTKQLSYSWKNHMKEFVEATWGADLYLTRPSHKAIGGRICKRKHKTM